jgi:hypothetical protein
MTLALDDPDELLKPEDVSKWLKVKIRTLSQWRIEGNGPPFLKLGHMPNSGVRYRRGDVDAWLADLDRTAVQG